MFFNVSNRVTFSSAFGEELFSETGWTELCRIIQDTVLKLLLPEPDLLFK